MNNITKSNAFKAGFALCFLAMSYPAFTSTDDKQFGRYVTTTTEQRPPSETGTVLDMPIQREFPRTIKTIGEAIAYTLKGTGYELLPYESSSHDVQQLYEYELPLSNRKISPMTLKEGLLNLVGQAYQVVLDPVHRKITFKLRRDYQRL